MAKLFDCAEQQSKKDGTSISYTKCEVVCFRFKKQCGPKSLNKLVGLDGVILEKTEEVTAYIGYWGSVSQQQATS